MGGGGTFLGKVEPKVLPSFDSPTILLAVFSQQLKILLTALNITILLFPTLNIIYRLLILNMFLEIGGLVWQFVSLKQSINKISQTMRKRRSTQVKN